MVTATEKIRARKAVNHAVAAGVIVPGSCEQCGASPAQGHHDDYTKPLDVRWLCAGCHSRHHNQKHALTKVCVVCGKTFAPHPTKRARAKTCSDACRSTAISHALLAKPVVPPWVKLDAAKAAEIRRRYAAGGVTHRSLAAEFGVHHKQIGAIVRGEAWTK